MDSRDWLRKMAKTVKKGEIIKLSFEGREFEAIVIDPNGLGKNQPSVGFGFGMMERHGGLPDATASSWLEGLQESKEKVLKVPSGKVFKVSRITGLDNNEYLVLEVSDWVVLAADVIKKSRLKKKTTDKLVDFLSWFAVKGFYADAYAILKGAYTEADSRSVSAWMRARLDGIARRNNYTRFLQAQGCEEWYEYANWTDYVYKGLFGMKKREMVEKWEPVEGNKSIGRNYIPEIEGLEAVAYCENQVIELFHSDLKQAHDDAIGYAIKKFKLDFQ